jgi:hypothetical protein
MLRRLAAIMLLPLVVCATAAAALATSTVALAPIVTQNVSGAQIAAITDKLADGLVQDADRSVVPAFRLADQAVPLGKVQLTTLTPLVYPTYIAVPVQISVDGRVARTVTSGYRVQSYIHTAVAAHDLSPGTLLGPDDLTLARVLSNGRPAVAVAALVVEQTAVNELVKAGAGAILVVHDGPVALTADVIARSGGGLGESVTVYNAQTNRLLSGVVTGPNRVEIVLPGGEQSDD